MHFRAFSIFDHAMKETCKSFPALAKFPPIPFLANGKRAHAADAAQALCLHGFLILDQRQVGVVGRIARMDAGHALHDMIGALLHIASRIDGRELAIVMQRFSNVQIDLWLLGKPLGNAATRAEGQDDGQNGTVILDRILEHRLFEGADVG